MNRDSEINPCLSCGACCAHYRCSFYWAETDDASPDGVPAEMTEKINDFRVAMRQVRETGSRWRCIALLGIIGKKAPCSIYQKRSSVCRDFMPSWADGNHNEHCDAARIAWGLKPLTRDDWEKPRHFPRAA